jgi:hypothetical protein
MARGVEYAGLLPSAQIVTVDLKDQNGETFQMNRMVRRIVGDCFDDVTAHNVALSFSAHVDLMFIDHHHDYEHTNRCLERYLPQVSPWLVVMDDIRLNASMAKLWADLTAAYGEKAVDLTDASFREKNVGFGLLVLR